MPTSGFFLKGVTKNLHYWKSQCLPISERTLDIFTQEQNNIYQALQIGFAFHPTQPEAIHLTMALFECVEAKGIWREWLPVLEKAVMTESATGRIRIGLLNQIGFVHILKGAYESARKYHEEAEALAQAFPLGLANAWLGLAQVAFAHHQYKVAEKYSILALEIFEQLAESKKVSATNNLLGRIALEQGDFPKAEFHFGQSVTIRRGFGPKHFLAQMLNNLALALQKQQRFAEALATYQEALDLLPPGQNSLSQVGLQNSLGSLHFALGAYAQAETIFQTIDAHYLHSIGAILWLASRANNLGNVYLKQKQWMLAETYLDKAITYWRQLEDEINLANSLGDLMEALIAQKRIVEAKIHAEEAIRLLAKYPQNAWACDRLIRIMTKRDTLA